MTKPFAGIWPAMITPLNDDESVNHAAVEQLVERFVEEQLGGLYILGSTGQWPLLTLDTRRAVAERVVQAADGRIPVIVHVGATATEDALQLARHAESIGADGVSSVAPIYYGHSVDDVFLHYQRIGAASSLPLYVYHLSSVSQIALDPRNYAERVMELPQIGGMKITDRDLFQFGVIAGTAGDRLRLFSGADEVVCHAALSGAVGAIGTFYNLWGRAVQRARAQFVAGDYAAGATFMAAFQSVLIEILASRSVWSFLRTAMQRFAQVEIGRPRAPLGQLDREWEEADVDRLVQRVNHAAGV